MAKNTILINDFRAGELTPDMDARVDLKDYYRGCRILENAMPIIEGGVARVPGTYYVRPVKTDEGWCLRVTKSGTGTGIVTSDLVPGINCGSDCYVFFVDGITVVLTATPDAGMSFSAWSGDGTGLVTRSVLMNGNKVVNAEFSSVPLNAYLIGWYKFNEGSGIVAANSATGGGSGGGLLPNLNVVDNNGDFWTYLPGYATSQKAGEVAFNNSYAWVSLPATRTFGQTACYGIFFKRRLDATIYHYMAICAFNKNNTPYEDLFSIYFMPWISTVQKYDFRSNWMGSTVGTLDLSLDNGLWYFSFIDNTGRCHIVFPNGTKLSTAPSSFASLDLNFLHAGLRASAGNGGFYTVQCSYGDWIIYNNKGLTVDEWVVWYDQLRSRYGMAARSGW